DSSEEMVYSNDSLFILCKSINSFFILKFKSFEFMLVKEYKIKVNDLLFYKDIYYLTDKINKIIINKERVIKNNEDNNYIKQREIQNKEQTVLLTDSNNKSIKNNKSNDNNSLTDNNKSNDNSLTDNSFDSLRNVKLFYSNGIKRTDLSFKDDIKCIKLIRNKLIYFTNKINSELVIIKNNKEKRRTTIDKLSCLSDEGYLGTGDGKLIINNKVIKVSSYPISGICKIKDTVYYCTVTGDIKKVKITDVEKYVVILVMLFFIIFWDKLVKLIVN
ncbi:hypothetical protein H311_04003, partial [Anncaliia algerae PRA109]